MTGADAQDAGNRPAKHLLRRLIPDSMLKERDIARRLGGRAGRQYLRLRLLDALGVRSQNHGVVPNFARSLLFVCYGNIMRSAMAEFATRHMLRERGLEEKVSVISAGMHAVPGREAHPWAQQAASELGIALVEHRAKPLTQEMIGKSDAVLVMDFQNKAELLTQFPQYRQKLHMLSVYAEGKGQYREIADPYHGDLDATRLCARQLLVCIRNLISSLFPDSGSAGETEFIENVQSGPGSKQRDPAGVGTDRTQIRLLTLRLETIGRH